MNVAKEDKRIRALYMNGSRIHPNAPEDIFQDCNIVCVATQTSPFTEDERRGNKFGDLLMIQEPGKLNKYGVILKNFTSFIKNIYFIAKLC